MATSKHVHGYLKVIKNDGEDGSCFPLMYSSIVGSGCDCDIRIHAPGVEDEHCSISPTELGRVKVKNLSKSSTVKVNGTNIKNRLVPLTHCDVISIAHRSFRFEYAADSPFHLHKDIGGIKKLVANAGMNESRISGLKTAAGATSDAVSQWNFTTYSSPANRQVAVVTPVMRTQGDIVEDEANSKTKDMGDAVRHLLSVSASNVDPNSVSSHQLNKVVNMLGTPRRHRSLAVKSHEKRGLTAACRAGSTDIVVQSISKSVPRKKSIGAAFKGGVKTPLKTPLSRSAKKLGVTPRRSVKALDGKDLTADSPEVMVLYVSEDTKKNKSMGGVCETEKETLIRTHSGAFLSASTPICNTVMMHSTSESKRKKKSLGVVSKIDRTPLRTARSVSAKKLGVTPRKSLSVKPQGNQDLAPFTIGSSEDMVPSVSESMSEKKSVRVVCENEKKTPQRTLHSEVVKELPSTPYSTDIKTQSSESKRKRKSLGVVFQIEGTPLKTPSSESVRKRGSTSKAKKKSSMPKRVSYIRTPESNEDAAVETLRIESDSNTGTLQTSEETPCRQASKRASRKDVVISEKKETSVSKRRVSSVTKTVTLSPGTATVVTKSPRRSSVNKPQKSSTGKKFDYMSPIESRKRKLDREEARSERAAKRLKLQGTPKSPDKNKSAALRIMCHKKFSLPATGYSERKKLDTEKKNVTLTRLPSTGKLIKKTMLPVPVSKKFNSSKSVIKSSSKKSSVFRGRGSLRVQLYASGSKNKNTKAESSNISACSKDGDKDLKEAATNVYSSQHSVSECKSRNELHDSFDRSNCLNSAGLPIDSSFEFEPQAIQNVCRRSKKSAASFGQGTSTPITKVHKMEHLSQVVNVLGDSIIVDQNDVDRSKYESQLTPVSDHSLRNISRSRSKSFHAVSSKDNISIEKQRTSSLGTFIQGRKRVSDHIDDSTTNTEDGHDTKRDEPPSTPLSGRKSLRSRNSGKSFSSLLDADIFILSPVDEQADSSVCRQSTDKDLADSICSSSFGRLVQNKNDLRSKSLSELHTGEIGHKSLSSGPKKRSDRSLQSIPSELGIDFSAKNHRASFEINGVNDPEVQIVEIPSRKSIRCGSYNRIMSLGKISSTTKTHDTTVGIQTNDIVKENHEIPSSHSSRRASRSSVKSLHNSVPMSNVNLSAVSQEMGGNYTIGDIEVNEVQTRKSLKYCNRSLGSSSCTPENNSSVGSWAITLNNSEVQIIDVPKAKFGRHGSEKSLASLHASTENREVSISDSIKSFAGSEDQYVGLQNRRSSTRKDLHKSSASSNLGSFMEDVSASDENQAANVDANLHDNSKIAHKSAKKTTRRSRHPSESFLNRSNLLSEQVESTPPNNRFGSNFCEQNFPSDIKVPPSILKSGAKSIRSGRKSVVRFMKFPSVECDNQTFTESPSTLLDIDHISSNNSLEVGSFNALRNEDSTNLNSSNVLSGSALKKLHSSASPAKSGVVEDSSLRNREPSFKTNEIVLSSRRRRSSRGETSVQSDITVCSLESFDNLDSVRTKRRSSTNSEVGTSTFDSSGTASYIGNETTFDFDTVKTPRLSKDDVVSPLSNTAFSSSGSRSSTKSKHIRKIPSVCLVDIGLERSNNSSSLFEIPQCSSQEITGALPISSNADRSEHYLIYDLDSGTMSALKSPLISLPGVELPNTPRTRKSGRSSMKEVKGLSATPNQEKSPRCDLLDVGVKSVTVPVTESSVDVPDFKILCTSPKTQTSPLNDFAGVKELRSSIETSRILASPADDLSGARGLERLLTTPKVQRSPMNDLSDVRGPKRLMKTPRTQRSPANDLTDVRGVKRLLGTPKAQKSPLNDLSDVRGLRRLVRTPKPPNSPANDLTDVRGVKRLLGTPKVQKSPLNDLSDLRGLRKLMATPKTQNSPLNDLSDMRGIKRLLGTPKVQYSPLNDLSDVRGLRRLMKTPRTPRSPANDLTYDKGVKRLLTTPKLQKSPLNDLSYVRGLRRLMKTPKTPESPVNNLSDVSGVKKLFRSPRAQKSPLNDLSDVSGVERLFRIPKSLNDSEDAEFHGEMIETGESPVNKLSDDCGVRKLQILDVTSSLDVYKHVAHNNSLSDSVVSVVDSPVHGKITSGNLVKSEIDIFGNSTPSPARLTRSKKILALCGDSASSPSTKGTLGHGMVNQSVSPSACISNAVEQMADLVVPLKQVTRKLRALEETIESEEVKTCTLPVRSRRGKALQELGSAVQTLHPDSDRLETCDVSKETEDSSTHTKASISDMGATPEKQTAILHNKIIHGAAGTLDISPSVAVKTSRTTRQRNRIPELTPNLNEWESLSPAPGVELRRQTRRNIVVPSPASDVGSKRPTRRNISQSPASDVGSKRPTRRNISQSPASDVGSKRPTRWNISQSPASDVGSKRPTRRNITQSPASDVGSKRPTRRNITQSPASDVGSKRPTRQNITQSPASDVGSRKQTRQNITQSPASGVGSRKQTRQNKQTENDEPVMPEDAVSQEKKQAVEVRKGRGNKKTEQVEPVVLEEASSQESEKRAVVRKGRGNKKTNDVESIKPEEASSQESEKRAVVRKGRGNKKTNDVESITPEEASSQESKKPAVEVRRGRRNKKTDIVEPIILEAESSQENKPAVELRKGRRNKKTEHVEPIIPEESETNGKEYTKPATEVKKGKVNKEADLTSEQHTPNQDSSKSDSDARKTRQNKTTEFVESVALENHACAQGTVTVRKGRSNKKTGQVESLTSAVLVQDDHKVRKGRSNKKTEPDYGVLGQVNAEPGEEVRGVRQTRKDIVMETTVSKQPVRKAQQNKENVDHELAGPEDLVPGNKPDSRSRRAKQPGKLATKHLSPVNNVLQDEVQKQATSKHVTFSTETEELRETKVKTRAKTKVASGSEEKPSRKRPREATQEVTTSPSPRKTRSKRAR